MHANLLIAREDAILVVTAAIGGGALHLVGFPAGWLTGAMLAVALVSLARPWTGPSDIVVQIGMLLSGCVIGSSATPEAVQAISRYPVSILLLFACMALTIIVTGFVLVRFGKWTRLDALLASAPGALSAVMVIARERDGDVPRIAIVQFFRLFVLVAAVPSLLVLSGMGTLQTDVAMPAAGWFDTGVMVVAGLVTGLALQRLGVVAPMVLGSTLASTALHAFGIVHGSLPLPMATLGFVILGGMIGARLGGLDRRSFARVLPLALAAFIASIAVAAILAWPASSFAGVSYGAAFIAFAPGGLEAMAILAVVLGFDPLYVGAHHLVRFLAVGLLLPILVTRLTTKRDHASGR